MKPDLAFKILRIILGLTGVGLMTAAFAVLLPVAWMAAAHEWLGLGELPAGPITIYLARSTSLLYAVHGFLLFYVARRLREHLPLAKIFGYLHVALGVTMLGVDLTTPMPWYWTASEGVPVALTGIAILWLSKQAGRTL